MKFLLGKPGMGCKGPVPLIRKLTTEPLSYLRSNEDSLPNYGRRYRAGQRISSAFVESAVNQLIDKRMSKSQQTRWDPRHSVHGKQGDPDTDGAGDLGVAQVGFEVQAQDLSYLSHRDPGGRHGRPKNRPACPRSRSLARARDRPRSG
ncbi:hypothetical protein [Variovorax gracilis]|uniref:hypothetical protein n=1 Tax=Variovorax gracilis TaxID=3053502 RepID=UPI004038197F